MPDVLESQIDDFITRWSPSGGRERANYQIFLTELCDLLDLPHPEPAQADASANVYTFDRAITHHKADGSSAARFIDLYRAGHFVLETKQGVEAAAKADQTGLSQASNPVKSALGHGKRGTAGYDKAMTRAHAQAEGYIRDLPAGEGRPPFLIVCDIGYVFELYAEFTVSGGRYQRFPDPKNHRISLEDLRKPEVRELFRAIWTDPHSLDPSKRIAKVTRDIADRLAKLAKSLEAEQHDPEVVAVFLQRCLFTMFAEDIGLLPEHGFLELLQKVDENPASFPTLVTTLWREMSTGTDYSALLFQKIAHFNGGLFENATALPLTKEQVDLLIDAAKADWTEVDPAIFGTLLERALDPRERHKLGAHYTPRSYVERLIEPTVIEPLREQWESVKAAAVLLLEQEKESKARAEVEQFHHELCRLRILDPACGSGNFLYVTLEHLKQLEAEVLDFFERIGGDRTLEMDSFKVRPDQFFGMELNPSAVSIAQLVLWIGYFQWHFKTTGKADTNDRPLLPKQNTILHQDAVLAYDEKIPRRDAEGKVVQIWDGITTKPHPVTGKEVPDESAKKVLYDYTNPRRPEWPEADYVVGNPPFVGASRMRDFLGDGYTEAVRKAWKGDVPESADFVMFWWEKCARLLRDGKIERFGLITTNSIHQTFNRRILEKHLGDEKKPMHLAFAIPDHPWVDSADGAAVRIAMTVAQKNWDSGLLLRIDNVAVDIESEASFRFEELHGEIRPDLSVGADLRLAEALESNRGIAVKGFELGNQGFLFDLEKAITLWEKQPDARNVVRPYVNGIDVRNGKCYRAVIDFHGLSEENAKTKFPSLYQHILVEVLSDRSVNREERTKSRWWLFRRSGQELRNATERLERVIVTTRTAKFRIFQFIKSDVCVESTNVVVAVESAVMLSVLSSRIHVIWALRKGSKLGIGNDPRYTHDTCFETFPFPDPDAATRERIRELGERLDAHRKRQQELHPDLTLTGIYNVLEKLRSGEPLTPKERKIHDDGLVSVLKQIHDDLDEAVFHAYGWDDLWAKRPGNTGNPVAERATVPTAEPASPLVGSVAASATPDAASEANAESVTTFATLDQDAWENELLERLVALNHERAAEEKAGKIRWLRPDFQNPDGDANDATSTQSELALPAAKKKAATKAKKLTWPDRLPDQVTAIRTLLPETGPDPEALSTAFGRQSVKREEQISEVLEVLASLGQV